MNADFTEGGGLTAGWYPTVDELLGRDADQDKDADGMLKYFANDPFPNEGDNEYLDTVTFCQDVLDEKGVSWKKKS